LEGQSYPEGQASQEVQASLEVQTGLERLAVLLAQAGFEVERAADPQALLWGKLVVNSAINPLTALLDVTNGELLANEPARQLLGAVARETAGAAAALGIELPYPDPVAMVESVARLTAANSSSMRQDLRRGAPTEIDAINGAIYRQAAGEKAGSEPPAAAPLNWALWKLVKGRALILERKNILERKPVD
jgi:2-dehydropantoate 2-reductase